MLYAALGMSQVATRGTADTLNARALSDGDVPQNKHSSDDGERVCQSISHSSGSDSDDSGSSSSKHNEDRSADPTRRRRPQRRGATRHKRQHRWRPTQRKAFAGVTLDLSDAGIDDEALYLVRRATAFLFSKVFGSVLCGHRCHYSREESPPFVVPHAPTCTTEIEVSVLAVMVMMKS